MGWFQARRRANGECEESATGLGRRFGKGFGWRVRKRGRGIGQQLLLRWLHCEGTSTMHRLDTSTSTTLPCGNGYAWRGG